MAVQVKVDFRQLHALQRQPEMVLRALDGAVRDGARRTLDLSSFLVPRGDPSDDSNLAETGFVSGPEHNMERLSTTATAGYEHPAAGAIHEGYHWGLQTQRPPPQFLKQAFRKSRAFARRAIAAQVASTLRRLFPST